MGSHTEVDDRRRSCESTTKTKSNRNNWEPRDVNAGLIGPLVVTRHGMARPDGSPKDVDREFAMLFMIIDENTSHYLKHNIDSYVQDPKSVNKLDFVPSDLEGNLNFAGMGFAGSNFKASINGYLFGTLPTPVMKRGEHVRWYVMTMGGGANFHTPHWHGNVVTVDKHHTDIFSISPAQFVTADMVPDKAGTWMFHCHIDEHMEAGNDGNVSSSTVGGNSETDLPQFHVRNRPVTHLANRSVASREQDISSASGVISAVVADGASPTLDCCNIAISLIDLTSAATVKKARANNSDNREKFGLQLSIRRENFNSMTAR